MKLFYAMHEELLKKYADTKTDIINARNGMSSEQIESAKGEIIKECQINDFTPGESEQLFNISDGVATIPITGMLVQKVDICAAFFDETITTYRFIREAAMQANNDPRVNKIVFDVNSGGGVVSGCEETSQVMRGLNKPTFTVVHDMAASAAFWLAASTDEIIGVSATGFTGSIGVAVEVINRDGMDEKHGVKRVILTNTTSKEKRPDLMTEEGQSIMIEELDAVFNVFADSILIKRSGKLSREDIENMGGKVFISSEALDMGLIDKSMTVEESISHVLQFNGKSASADSGAGNMEGSMNHKEFLEKNPEAKAEYEKEIAAARTEGNEESVKADRERTAKMLKLAGLPTQTKAVAEAITGGMSVEDFAVAEAETRDEVRIKKAGEQTGMDGVDADGQIPVKPDAEKEKAKKTESDVSDYLKESNKGGR